MYKLYIALNNAVVNSRVFEFWLKDARQRATPDMIAELNNLVVKFDEISIAVNKLHKDAVEKGFHNDHD